MFTLKKLSLFILFAVTALILTGVCFGVYILHSSSRETAAADVMPKQTTRTASAAPNQETLTPAAPITSSGGQTKNATPNLTCRGQSYSNPASINTVGLADGFTKVVDAPIEYQVFGNTITEVRRSIDNCALRASSAGTNHALTGYQMTWQYTVIPNSTRACSLGGVKIAMHINQYLPKFFPTPSTPAQTQQIWQSYLASLRTHENGHVAYNIDYATRLTGALQNLQNLDCGSIKSQAENIVQIYTDMLNTANELYDSTTNHGATQGAVL